MHAYASEDPLFRALNAKGQRETDGALGDFCVRCHAPLAVELGLTDDGLNLDALDPAVLGVNCYFCHTAESVEGRHNNPVVLARDGVLRGSYADPVDNAFHRSAYSPLLDRDAPDSAGLCGSCHDIVTPSGAHIERTYLEWEESVYAREDTAFQRLTCGNCHMGGTDGPIAERTGEVFPERRRHAHTFPGVDIALTDFPHRELQRSLVEDELDRTLNPQLCVTNDPIALETTILVDLENLAAGHAFPSGATAERRVWVELVATQGDQEVWVAGRVEPGVAVDETGDPQRWDIGETHRDAAGRKTHLFWEVEEVEAYQLPPPTAFLETDPAWQDPHRIRTWVVEGIQPDRVSLRVKLRPFPLDFARELVETEGVEPSVAESIPTFDLDSAALEWTADLGRSCVR